MLQFYHMERKLKEYTRFIESEAKNSSPNLRDYHKVMVEQFQHERLVHLIITLFFALFVLIVFIVTLGLFITLPNTVWGNILMWSAAFTTLILLVITLFYVRHYYRLENGVQKLEDITKKLYAIEDKH